MLLTEIETSPTLSGNKLSRPRLWRCASSWRAGAVCTPTGEESTVKEVYADTAIHCSNDGVAGVSLEQPRGRQAHSGPVAREGI